MDTSHATKTGPIRESSERKTAVLIAFTFLKAGAEQSGTSIRPIQAMFLNKMTLE